MQYAISKEEMKERAKEALNIEQALIKGNGGNPPKLPAMTREEAEKSYQFYDNADAIMKAFDVWVAYPVKKYSRDFQRRYEAFCGGWLHFWDKNISTEVEERKLYIKWDDVKGFVILYISKETKHKGYRITLTIEGPGDPPVAPPPPPPGDV